MRRFVLGTIELFGRYTAVLIFALAHGIMELPDVGPVGPAAADVLLSPETKSRLIKTFDDEWIKLVDQNVRLE